MIALGEVVEWKPRLDTSAKISILEDILSYLEKFAADVKAFFASEPTPFFSSFWSQPDNNRVGPAEAQQVEQVSHMSLTAQ